MPAARTKIPLPIQRAVKVEAGHRCAIPTCRATSGLEIHHISPWAKVREHTFENLILLCAVCHARATKGEIDVHEMRAYKANLGLLVSRYGELERRVLDMFVQDAALEEVEIDVAHRLLLKHLLDDGMLVELGWGTNTLRFFTVTKEEVHSGPVRWGLTPSGSDLVDRLRRARRVE